jgi:DNA-binding transcriptional ArsR family regulator
MKNPERGLHSAVAKMYGFEGQYIGRVIKAYKNQIAENGGIEPIEPNNEPIEPGKDRFDGPDRFDEREKWEEAAPKAQKKLTGSLVHQEEEEDSGQKSPQRTGETSPSGLNDNQSIKHVQDMIKELRGLMDGRLARLEELAGENAYQITLANERAAERLEILEEAAQPKRTTKPMKTQTAIVEALTGGRRRTTNQLAADLEVSPSAIRNALVHLKDKGLIVVEKESQRSGDRVVNTNLVHLKQY